MTCREGRSGTRASLHGRGAGGVSGCVEEWRLRAALTIEEEGVEVLVVWV